MPIVDDEDPTTIIGYSVNYIVFIDNISPFDVDVTIDSLVDEYSPDLSASICSPTTILVGGTASCEFTREFPPDAESFANMVTVGGVDGNGYRIQPVDSNRVDPQG